MSLNLDLLLTSEATFDQLIKKTIQTIRTDEDIETTLKKVLLFCKYTFALHYHQRKKYLCLYFIRDIAQAINSTYFEKMLDEYLPVKLLKTVYLEIAKKDSELQEIKGYPQLNDQKEYSDRLIRFAIETIRFWTIRLALSSSKSQFSDVYQEMKNLPVEITKNFEFYKFEKLTVGLIGQDEKPEQDEFNTLISKLIQKYSECKIVIDQKIKQAVLKEEQIQLKPITEKLRDFLLSFFSKYSSIEKGASIDKDVLVVNFHIINTLFKRIGNRFQISTQELIPLTKEVFQGNQTSDFSSIDPMDIIHLRCIHEQNAVNAQPEDLQQQELNLQGSTVEREVPSLW